ncbi:cytochrome P450 [Amycolatopsis sp. H20-H5]|uniref:cytochrome P450 n=1 Tax=Amycolatopsis sp. H20-H5 TaxID=3046309 RepID=UPI002DBA1F90|nr:cytochrome P450 [Amycolatopsis sp. H20-H5]MEC3975010.1 cytochrome P450 [Amycolatopsis sp. H20-H5]
MSTEPLAYPILRTDPSSPPVDEYAQLRRDQPVCPINLATGDPGWLVTSYEHARTVLSDRRFSREAVFAEGAPRYQATLPNPDSVQNMDPPRHSRVRGLANQAFSARRVELLRPRIAEVTAELLDEMAADGGPVDLNLAFGRPLPLRVICEMLGVPFADHQKFVDWTERIMSLGEFTGAEIAEAFGAMKAYFKDLVVAKRADPGDDLLSVLTSVADSEGTLTESEVMHLGTAILVAGHDTSVTVIASATLTLLRNPDQVALLRREPERWPAAVEELIRLDNPGVVINPRIATCDIPLGDVVIPKGAAVLAHVGAASRDESVLEDPDTFDVTRTTGTLLSLGHGPHFCIGASLAKAELEIGLRALFERFPELRLAVDPDQLEWRDKAALGGFKQFPVAW